LSEENKRPVGSPILAISLLALILLLLLFSSRPPAPSPASAPTTEFSAERAGQVLKRLVGDGIAHPSGSQQNDVVRGRVIEDLKNAGYDPSVQTGFSCDEYGDCGTVQNVVARLDGTEPGQAVLVAAHYDSVAAGPGASDDGVGAASVIEIARALKARNTPRHSVVILIDDGEEAGLLGARVFVASHPYAKEVRAAVNLDNRGTSGPSFMFETGDANEWVVKLYAKSVARPATSSVFYTAYKQLPNDTDFTVFKAAGYQGVNFAIIGDEPHYHTQLDNFQNASTASLQDQGADGLSMAFALANADISNPPVGEATFFDVLNKWTVVWPARWTLKIAIAALVLLLVPIGWLIYTKRLSARASVWGFSYFPLTIAIVGALAFVLHRALRMTGAQPIDFIAYPLPAVVAFWSLGVVLVILVALGFARRSGAWGLWAGIWFWWLSLSIVVAALVPGLAYLLLVPGCVAVLAALPAALRRIESPVAAFLGFLLPLLTAAVVGFGLVLSLYPALGVVSFVVISISVGILFTPIAPLVARFKNSGNYSSALLPLAALAVCAISAFLSFVVPAYSAKAPEHLNIEYFQDADSGRSQWVLWPASGKLPEPLRVTTNFHHDDKPFFPWDADSPFFANAPHLDLAPPTFTILESSESQGRRVFRALLRSERGAADAAVFFPPDSGIENVSMEDYPVGNQSEQIRRGANGWYHFECSTMPAKGVELAFTLPLGKPLIVTAMDETYSLPLEGSFLVKARPFTATAFGDGDRTLITRHVQLLP
jgi:Peptidase family M28